HVVLPIYLPIWLLGSSLFSAQLAALRGLPYSFASHFAPAMLQQALQIYRENFRPSEFLDKPHVMVAAPLLAAEDDAQAAYLATTAYQRSLSLIRGHSLRMKPPVDNMETLWNARERQAVLGMYGKALVGAPDSVKEQLQQLVASTQPDEIIFTCDVYNFDHRLRALAIAASFTEE